MSLNEYAKVFINLDDIKKLKKQKFEYWKIENEGETLLVDENTKILKLIDSDVYLILPKNRQNNKEIKLLAYFFEDRIIEIKEKELTFNKGTLIFKDAIQLLNYLLLEKHKKFDLKSLQEKVLNEFMNEIEKLVGSFVIQSEKFVEELREHLENRLEEIEDELNNMTNRNSKTFKQLAKKRAILVQKIEALEDALISPKDPKIFGQILKKHLNNSFLKEATLMVEKVENVEEKESKEIITYEYKLVIPKIEYEVILETDTRTSESILKELGGYLIIVSEKDITVTQFYIKLKNDNKETKIKNLITEPGQIKQVALDDEENVYLVLENETVKQLRITNKEKDLLEIVKDLILKIDSRVEIIKEYGFVSRFNKEGEPELLINLFVRPVVKRIYGKKLELGRYNPDPKAEWFFPNMYYTDTIEPIKGKFLEIIKEGLDNIYIRILIGYVFSLYFREILSKETSLFPHLWIYGRDPGTGKTTLLNLLKTLIGVKDFVATQSVAQIRNLMNYFRNIVVIDDINSITKGEDKEFIVSILKSVSTSQGIKITLGTGESFVVKSLLGVSSNFTPSKVLGEVEEALYSRLLMLNINSRNALDRRWIEKFYKNLPVPEGKGEMSFYSFVVFIYNKLLEMLKTTDIVQEFREIKSIVREVLKEVAENYGNLRILEERFVDVVSLVILGQLIANKIGLIHEKMNLINKESYIKNEGKEIIKELMKSNILYRSQENVEILSLLAEKQELRFLEKYIIRAIEVSDKNTLCFIKSKGYLKLVYWGEIKKEFLKEAKEMGLINKPTDFKEIMESRGYTFEDFQIRKRNLIKDGETKEYYIISSPESPRRIRVINVPWVEAQDLLKEISINYFIIDLDNKKVEFVRRTEDDLEEKIKEVLRHEDY